MQEARKEGKTKLEGTARAVNGIFFIQFGKKKRRHENEKSSKHMKEAAECILSGILAVILFMGFAEVNACGADTKMPQEYISYCEQIGKDCQICPELLEAIIEQESGGNPDAVGLFGEIGLMQVCPKYHKMRAVHLNVYDLSDPWGNILVGADYLAELFEEYGDTGTVLMVYNGTEGAEERGVRGDYTDYARKIMERAQQFERLHEK